MLKIFATSIMRSVDRQVNVCIFSHPRTERSIVLEIIADIECLFPNICFTYNQRLIVRFLFSNAKSKLIGVGVPTGARGYLIY